jgi:hypothetical protein
MVAVLQQREMRDRQKEVDRQKKPTKNERVVFKETSRDMAMEPGPFKLQTSAYNDDGVHVLQLTMIAKIMHQKAHRAHFCLNMMATWNN